MDHDDDVEHLFSWLQTPELRYREFAGAREITDSVVIVQQQRADNAPVPQDEPVDAPYHDARLDEEYPKDEFPDQGETRVEMLPEAPPAAREDAGIGGARGVGRGPLIIAPVPMSEEPTPQTRPAAPPPGRSLLGGAYRENDAEGRGSGGGEQPQSSVQDGEQRDQHPLDAVFGRLAGGRSRLPDPRERLRHIPGLGPPAGRPR